jgi:BirA family biotin operon repressor/biotin-[acetyl-CoA-carboxylase] ligase
MSPQNSQKPREIHALLGYKIYYYDEVSSTNDIAKEVAKKSDKERIVILAETQTRGKGRLERQWVSPKGGIWLSIILRPKISPKEALKLTFITSSAVAKTIQQLFGLKAEVKWPNDVLVNGRKICGILTEIETEKNIVEFVIIGIGINADVDLEAFPREIRETATSLKHELGYGVERKTLVNTVMQNFEHRYKRLSRGMWSLLLQEWKSLAAFLGKQVEVTSFDEVIVGEAWDVNDDGALIIRLENGVLKRVVAGDVILRKRV